MSLASFKSWILALGLSLLALLPAVRALAATNTYDFVYSGRLTTSNGKPVTGPVAMQITFFHDGAGTTPVLAVANGLTKVGLQEGVFQVRLTLSAADYGLVFSEVGQGVWVQVTDLTNSPKQPYALQQLLVAPYAARVPIDENTAAFNAAGKLTIGPSGTPTSGQFLTKDTSGTFVWATPSASYAALQGQPVLNVAPGGGQVLAYDGANWVPKTVDLNPVTSLTASAPFSVLSGNSLPSVSVTAASSTTSGYLSAADWTAFNSALSQSGGSLTGALNAGNQPLHHLATPTTGAAAATKGYVDNLGVNANGTVSMTGSWAVGAQDITSTGSLLMGPAKVLGVGAWPADPSGLVAADKGKVWFNTTDSQLHYFNGATPFALAKAGIGLTSLNGLTDTAQSFAVGQSGTGPAFASASSTHTLNIPLAASSSVAAGLLAQTDYAAFAAKIKGVSAGSGLTTSAAAGTVTASLATLGAAGTYTKLTTNTQGFAVSGVGIATSDIPALNASAIQSGVLPASRGGTGLLNAPATGQLLMGSGSGYILANLSSGAGVVVNSGAGAMDLTTAQDLRPAAAPTFSTVVLIGVPAALLKSTSGGAVTNATASDLSTALGYVPLNRLGDTMSGGLTVAAMTEHGTTSLSTSQSNEGRIYFDLGTSHFQLSEQGSAYHPMALGGSLRAVSTASGLSGGVAAASGTVALASLGTPGAYTVIYTDAFGHVVGGSSLDQANLPNLDAGLLTTGTFALLSGGTGVNQFTTNGVIVGSGASPLSATNPGGLGNVLTADSSGAPAFTPSNLASAAAFSGVLAVANGGAGLNAIGTANQWFGVGSGNTSEYKSVVGTGNEVTSTNGSGTLSPRTLTLGTPQQLHSAATPTFAGLVTTGNVALGLNAPAAQLGLAGALTERGIGPLAPSQAGQGVLYFDSIQGRFRVSENSAGFQTLSSGTAPTVISTGLGLNGGTFATAGTVSLAPVGAAGAYPAVIVDGYGRVTAGASLSSTNLPLLDASQFSSRTISGLYGGTGLSTAPANGVLLTGDGDGFAAGVLTAGATQSVVIVNTAGGISLDTVQDLRLAATPTFAGAALPGLAAKMLKTSSSGAVGAATAADLTTTLAYAPLNRAADTMSGTLTVATLSARGTNVAAPTAANQGELYFDVATEHFRIAEGTGTYAQLATGGSVTRISAGAGLSGSSFTATGTLGLATVGAAGTYAKVSTDAYGHVTSGTNLVPQDVPPLDASAISSGILPVARGGTGLPTLPANGQLLVGNGTSYGLANLSSGPLSGLQIVNSAGTIALATAQDIRPVASPNFAGVILSGLPSMLLKTSSAGLLSSAGSPDFLATLGYLPLNRAGDTLTGSLNLTALAAPSAPTPGLSQANQGAIYFDSSTGHFKVSENGGPYGLLAAVGSVSAVSAGTGLTGGVIQGSGTLGLQSVGTSGTYTKVSTDAYGHITAATSLIKSDLPTLSATAFTVGTFGLVNGGTGVTAFTNNGVLVGTGPSALSATAAGGADNVLTVNSASQPGFGAVNLASPSAVSDILPAANGGTGLSSGNSGAAPYYSTTSAVTSASAFAANAVLIGGGTAGPAAAAPLGNGQVLIGTAGSPAASNITAATNNGIVIASGSGSIGLATAQDLRPSAVPTFAGLTLTANANLSSGTVQAGIDVAGTGDLTATPGVGSVRGANTSGSNIAGTALVLAGGNGTGSAVSGSIQLQTAPAGVSGANANVLSTAVMLNSAGNVGIGSLAPAGSLDVSGSICFSGTNCRTLWPTIIQSLTSASGLSGGLINSSGTLSLGLSGTAGTYLKVSTDAYGRVSTGGLLLPADIPPLPAAALTSGTLNLALVPNLPASILSSGTVTLTQLGVYPATLVTSGTASLSTLPGLSASALNSGTFNSAQMPSTLPASILTSGVVNVAQWPNLSTSSLTSGVLAVGVGGTGLAATAGAGQIPLGNSTGYTLSTLTAGGALQIASGAGTVSISQSLLSSTASTMTGRLNLAVNGLNVGSGELLTASGNVGVGTTAPLLPLDVEGTVGYPASSGAIQAGVASFGASGTTNLNTLAVGSYAGPPFGIWMQVDKKTDFSVHAPLAMQHQGGNIGIGTSAPDAGFSLLAAGQTAVVDIYSASGTASYGIIEASGQGNLSNIAGHPLSLQPNYGYIGIGLPPDINGLEINPASSGNELLRLSLLGSGSPYMVFTSQLDYFPQAVMGTNDNGNFTSDILFGATPSYNTLPPELMRVKANGSVGIGTKVPAGLLDVAVNNGSSTVSALTVLASNGNVGIGSSAPAALLDIAYASGTLHALTVSSSTGAVGIGTATPINSLDVIGKAALGIYAGLAVAPANSFIIGNRLGIGVSAPVASLDVLGTIRSTTGGFEFPDGTTMNSGTANFFNINRTSTTSMSFAADSGTTNTPSYNLAFAAGSGTRMIILDNGNIGIGTTAAKSALDVEGGVAIGTYAGINAAGTNNLLVSGNIGIGTSATNVAKLSVLGGSVGIGTTAPLNLLGISGSLASGIYAGVNAAPTHGFITSGSVGIGFAAPVNGMDVATSAAIGTGYAGIATTGLIVQGNIGIGTSSPIAKVDIGRNAGNPFLDFESVASANNDRNYFIRMDYDWKGPIADCPINNDCSRFVIAAANDIYDGDGDEVWFQGSQRLVMNTGSWDIELTTALGLAASGTISPGLEAYEWDINTNSAMAILGNGNVGIGSTQPVARLDVAGTVKLGTAGQPFTAAGACTTTSVMPTNTSALTIACGIVPSSLVALSCTNATPFTTVGTALLCYPTGTTGSISCSTTLANTVSSVLYCKWMQP